MAGSVNLSNLAAIGGNRATTPSGFLKGVKSPGTSRAAAIWAKIAGSVRSSKIGAFVRANPLKCAVIGGAAFDFTVEAIAYKKTLKDYQTLQEGFRSLGYGLLLYDVTEEPEFEKIAEVLDKSTISRRVSKMLATDWTTTGLSDLLATYLTLTQQKGVEYVFSHNDQAKIDAICCFLQGMGVTSEDFKAGLYAEDIDAFLGSAIDVNDTTSMRDTATQLASDYAELRNPLAKGRSRLLDFQSFVRFETCRNFLSAFYGQPTTLDEAVKAINANYSKGESVPYKDDGDASKVVVTTGGENEGPVDVNTIFNNNEQAVDTAAESYYNEEE